ncbi:sulfotransferase family protein [Pseudolysobacter antarcticus]|uniref:Sulfotransferase family protein n=1 Tax=Pseudolysobacter antarcticus TaxID=2511995 RepID=A0A411HI94_9GAMM|nr:sulfotransferase [Pseudolysobacter antarcticus]QBB70117.1 sulfotransferase family protein [Pseudolysobacter antarcticus]
MPVKQKSQAATRLQGLTPYAIQQVIATANALELGRINDAERHIQGALAVFPHHPEILRLLAAILQMRGQLADAVATMQRAVSLRPLDALYYNTLGGVLSDNNDNDAAIASLRRACELDPALAIAWFNLGLVLMRCARSEEAVAALRQAVVLAPSHTSARVMLAEMLRASNRMDDAAAEFRRVIAMRPFTGPAWWGLADLKTVKFSDAEIEQMQRAMQHRDASDDDLIALGFALAHALEQHDRLADSLREIANANARARNRRIWSAAAHSAQLDAILQTFSQPPHPPHPPQPAVPAALGEQVIFIVSMPRSGSTLVEQILASHSQVEGAGELPDLPAVLNEESRRRQQPFPLWVPQMQPHDWQHLGQRYLERTAHWQQQRARFTDKLPNNWLYIGAIRAMLPAAKIIYVRRDPLETCLGCYRQNFSAHEYTRTFADLAAFWRDFDRAVRYWRQAAQSHVHENVYEDLVAYPESKIRELLVFCDLPFEPACLEFHKTQREVLTPSAAQVREPLRRDTARAKRYGSLLDPLRHALQLDAFSE